MKWSGAALTLQCKQFWERYRYVLLVILAGVVLLLLPGEGENVREQIVQTQYDMVFDVEAMEQKLERALSRIRGAGEVTVVLTLKEGERQVLAQDIRNSQTEQSRSTVIVSQGSGVEQPVVLQSICPQYQGALVVCEGGANPEVQLDVLSAVRALTGLSADKISICKCQ